MTDVSDLLDDFESVKPAVRWRRGGPRKYLSKVHQRAAARAAAKRRHYERMAEEPAYREAFLAKRRAVANARYQNDPDFAQRHRDRQKARHRARKASQEART